MSINLRPYQQRLKSELVTEWGLGRTNVLVQLPTGGGKSVIISDVINDHRGRAVIIAHRQELISQLSTHLARAGIFHSIIAPKQIISNIQAVHRILFQRSFVQPGANISVGSVDTLVARKAQLRDWAEQVGLWVIDEAHHVLRANKWGTAVEMFPNARGMGVTATPERADGKGISAATDGVFHAVRYGPTTKQLIDQGHLCDYVLFAPPASVSRAKLKVGTTGDYTPKSLRDEAERSTIVGDVVESYLKFAPGKRGVTFASDVATAERIARQFNAAGVTAAAVSAKTDDATRARMIRSFETGKIMQLVNVDLLGEGVDVPAIEVISLARPTKSLGVYLQQVGRVMRPSPGKPHGIIIDHVGNFEDHRLPDAPRQWSIEGRDKRSKKPDDLLAVTSCQKCFRPYEKYHVTCPHCGHRNKSEVKSDTREVVGDLVLVDKATLDFLCGRAQLASAHEVRRKAEHAAGPIAGKAAEKKQREKIEAQADLIDAINEWADVEITARGITQRECARLFYMTFGVDVLSALDGAHSAREFRERTDEIRSAHSTGNQADRGEPVAE